MTDEEAKMKAQVEQAVVSMVFLLNANSVPFPVAVAAAAKLLFGLARRTWIDKATFLELADKMWDWEQETDDAGPLINAGIALAEKVTGLVQAMMDKPDKPDDQVN